MQSQPTHPTKHIVLLLDFDGEAFTLTVCARRNVECIPITEMMQRLLCWDRNVMLKVLGGNPSAMAKHAAAIAEYTFAFPLTTELRGWVFAEVAERGEAGVTEALKRLLWNEAKQQRELLRSESAAFRDLD